MDDPAAVSVSSAENGTSTSEERSPDEAAFWIMTAALKRFVENEGNGDLPLEVHLLYTNQVPMIISFLQPLSPRQNLSKAGPGLHLMLSTSSYNLELVRPL